MTVIIPAWSRDALKLADNPIVKLAQLFSHHQLDTELLLLQPLPWLRYQLQQNHLSALDWWNVYDDIQHVHRPSGLPLGLEDLNLPQGTEFAYVGATVLLYRDGRVRGTVHFHPAGFVSRVDLLNDLGQRVLKVYDDRGFCSTQTTYSLRNHRIETLWFDPNGAVVMRRKDTPEVQLLDASGQVTNTYDSLEALLTERVMAHLKDRHDLIISAANPVTAEILTVIARQHRLAYLLDTRVAPTLPDDLFGAVERVVAPTEQMAAKFQQVNANLDTPVDVVSPYATKLALGNSTELPETTIAWAVNHLSASAQVLVGRQLVNWLVQDDQHVISVIATSKVSADRLAQQFKQQILSAATIDADSADGRLIDLVLYQLAHHQPLTGLGTQIPKELQTVIGQLQRIQVRYRVSDHDREAILSSARLLIDLGDIPDLQLQIAAISAGIPQINRVATGYVADQQNGRIVAHLDELPQALDYYLATLIHWNQSLVKSIGFLEQLAEPKLLAYWKGVMTYGK